MPSQRPASSAHKPRKRFGQNFLIDRGVVHAIMEAIRPEADDLLVEIGPGLGALTEPLLQRLDCLSVVEIDRDLIARLKKRYPPERLIVHEGDVLSLDFGALAETRGQTRKIRIVGNLPYNISTPLLFHLATFAEHIVDMHFMLQKEVVDRMVAYPGDVAGNAAYGRLSVMLQSRFYLEALFDVPPEAFDPPPRVRSAIVRMIPKPLSELTVADPECFARLVAAAFGQRRKMLRNTLKHWFSEGELTALGVSPAARAEELAPEDFERLANALFSQDSARIVSKRA
ncbi:MAG: 16S rRNA (adenine(1518)-N(6)/adenine(1519)-N(6))-dimethyltransferase RsmA [Zoogloeaceae bacterium]|jgi:16S rRNA (adenine1518-N6/adenine1519-N6)-dimethyltransferase|nr:16S rRNA (adenine(1518)-N(6)/adenine(1519)-N(6))-dimethyltransferase RsmA [Zoogloeaceae bacterium]